jgi:hypothetical protein
LSFGDIVLRHICDLSQIGGLEFLMQFRVGIDSAFRELCCQIFDEYGVDGIVFGGVLGDVGSCETRLAPVSRANAAT